jgi:hypothetical protein
MRIIPGGRGSSNKRGIHPGASWCEHDAPVLMNPTETGSYYARCLLCLAIGPECPNSEEARRTLKVVGAGRDGRYQGIEA